LWCFALRLPGGAILLDESSVSRGPDDLTGGNGHFVELKRLVIRAGNPMTLLEFFGSTGCLAGVIHENSR